MKMTSAQIRKALTDVWPDLEYIWLWDNTFWTGTVAQMEKLMARSRLRDMQFIDQFNDCDNFASQFLAEVRRIRYFSWIEGTLPEEERWPYAMFFVSGTQFRGVSKLHTANAAILDGRIYIVDMTPSEQRMWLADPKQDSLYFVSS